MTTEHKSKVCESGRLWNPSDRLANRLSYGEEHRKKLEAVERDAARIIAAELAKIEKEQRENLGWWSGDHIYSQEREVEELRFCRRKNPKARWETVAIYAICFHPAGSLLPKDEQEAYRLKFLRTAGSTAVPPIIYPEHQPNHFVLQEAAA